MKDFGLTIADLIIRKYGFKRTRCMFNGNRIIHMKYFDTSYKEWNDTITMMYDDERLLVSYSFDNLIDVHFSFMICHYNFLEDVIKVFGKIVASPDRSECLDPDYWGYPARFDTTFYE